MNPIANLPATQNLNKAQQSQGYNRQYFGGDEMDEVVLSNQEEQKKKKAWTIGGAILGAMALIGGCVFGANYFGYMGKDAKHLKGFKTLTTKNGDTTQELASIAKTTKAWTGASWGGVAETIKTTLDGKNDTKFKKIVLVASEDSQKALKESLGEDLFKKLTVIQANSDKIEDAVKNAVKYGKDKDNLIITDSSIDNLYDEIEKAIAPSDNSEKTEDADEEKKAKKEQNPTEASKASEAEQKEEANKTEKNEEPPKPEVKKQSSTTVDGKFYGLELNSVENAQKIFTSLQNDMKNASKDMDMCNKAKYITIDNLEENVNIFEKQHKQYLEFKKTKEALKTYYQKINEKLQNDNTIIEKQIKEEYTEEKRDEKMSLIANHEEKRKVYEDFNNEKAKLEATLKANNKIIKTIDKSNKKLKTKSSFEENFDTNYDIMIDTLDFNEKNKNKILAPAYEYKSILQNNIQACKDAVEKCNADAELYATKEALKKEITPYENALVVQESELNKTNESIKKTKNTLTKLFNIFVENYREEENKKPQDKVNSILSKVKKNLDEKKQTFEESIQ